MASNINIWAGSSSFFPGDTPFGYYDNDPDFQCDVESAADWAFKRLGWPIIDSELHQTNFFAAYEEAVTEYSNQINSYSARDQLFNLLGYPTGSVNLSNRYLPQTLRGTLRLSKEYGTEVGAGGTQTYYTGSISVKQNKQVYDFTNPNEVTLETGSFATNDITIRKIYHEPQPSIVKYFDPSLGTGIGTQNFLEQFGWGGMSVPGNFLIMPLYADVLRMQAIEMNDQIRKSWYSFQITNRRLRVFPIPSKDFTMWFHYTIDTDNFPLGPGASKNAGLGKISGYNNIPFNNLEYRYINDMGRQWIKKYALAIMKEMLGYVRGKYSTMPIPDGEVTLNADALLSDGKAEKEALVTELKELLDQMSQQAQMERKAAVAENLSKQLTFIPTKIYVR